VRRPPARLSLLLAALVVAAQPALATQAGNPAVAQVPNGVVALLEDRGRAWQTRDRALLEATMAPGAFAQRELRSFDNAAEVRFSTYRVSALTRFSGDIAWPRVRELYPGSEVSAFHVVEETAVSGVERLPYAESGFYTFVRAGADGGDRYEGWRLASDTDFEALGGFSPVPLWAGGPVRAVTSRNFVLLAHPDRVEQVRGVVQLAEQAYEEAKRFWPRPAGDRYVIVVPSTSAELGRMIQATIDLDKFVAFAGRTHRYEGDFPPAGVRVFINLERFARYDAAAQRGIMAHELIHAITTPASGPFVPVWVEEGLAMHGSEPESGVRAARGGRTPEEFPTSDLFYVGSVGDIVRTYARSQVAFEVLDAQRGRDSMARFYEQLGATRFSAGTSEYHVRRVVEGALGWSVEEWTKAWRDRL